MSQAPNPTTENSAAGIANTVIKVGETGIVAVAESLAITAVPWLGLPVIKQLWEGIFNFIADKFEKAAATGATFLVIDVQVGNEETQMSKELAAVIAAEKSGDANAIKIAIANYANAQSALVHDDGSHTSS